MPEAVVLAAGTPIGRAFKGPGLRPGPTTLNRPAVTPPARIVALAASGFEPEVMEVRPIEAVCRVLAATGVAIAAVVRAFAMILERLS